MHQPGPPRFVAAGETIELAPRDPDPDAEYSWQLVEQPDDSTVELGDEAVEYFMPDEPGRYVARLTAPDGEHDLTVRVFPGSLAPDGVGGTSGRSGVSGYRSGSGFSGFSGGVSGSARSGSGAVGSEAREGSGRPRVSLSAGPEGDEVVVRADPQPNPNSSERPDDLDVTFELDDRDDVDSDAVHVSGRRLTVPVERLTGRLRVHAVALGESGYSVPDTVELDPSDPDVVTDGGTTTHDDSAAAGEGEQSLDVSYPYHPPAWAEGAVIYEVYVRTYAGQEAEYDTAFDAIIDRLDHIESLGVDALWLTPVLQNDHAPHGYNITDFFSIAEDLGTREDYERLIDEAHDRDMKVLFDLVCNHSARAHPFFQDAVENRNSEYREWYEWQSDTEPGTYFDWEYIANFDFQHLPVRRHLLDAVDEWAELADGFRCDMAWAVPNNFWKEVHDRLKEYDSEFLLLDETIPYIPDFQAGLFDEHFDSTTYFALRQTGREDAAAESVLDAIDERTATGFPDYAGFLLYTENHDETRYLAECGRPAAEAAMGAIFTLPGATMVYAGQEFGQLGKRDDLAWQHTDETLTEFVRDLSATRADTPALDGRGEYTRVDYEVHDGADDRVVAYAREHDDSDPVIVALNFAEDPATIGCDAVTEATDLVSGETSANEDGLEVDSVAVFPADGTEFDE